MVGSRFLVLIPLMFIWIGGCSFAAEGSLFPSDSGIDAHVEEVWAGFQRADGKGYVKVASANSLCYDSVGERLIVADHSASAIYIINARLEIEAILSNSARATVNSTWLELPLDVAVDSKGRLYVVDAVARMVHILDLSLDHLGTVNVSSEWPGSPECVAVDHRDRVIIGDYRSGGHSRILVYEWIEEEKLVLQAEFPFSPPGKRPICGLPADIAVDSQDRIIISETTTPLIWPPRERALIFDKEFQWVAALGSRGSEPGQLSQAHTVTVGPSDTIAIASRGMRGWVSFFFSNGTYAGRIGDPVFGGFYSGPRGLLVTPDGKLLAGEEGGTKKIDINWESLHPVAVSPGEPPPPEPISETAIFLSFLLLLDRLRRKAWPRHNA